MRISHLHIQNFKRFTDLKIEGIPETAKLVLLIGSNGSGKSSLFDAFDWLQKGTIKSTFQGHDEYYGKSKDFFPRAEIFFFNDVHPILKIDTHIEGGKETSKKFIGRSSLRIVPKIPNNYNLSNISDDLDSPVSYTENDKRFINDVFAYIQSIDTALREPIFSGRSADTLKIFHDLIEPLNSSLMNIFGGTENTTIQISEFESASPHQPARLYFRKGKSKINYDLLSHGEKQVVILLLNFIVRKRYYEDTIIFIDEMDCHLNTALQKTLLDEIVTKWIPDSSQLWTASHALGFIDYARQSAEAVILDFDLLDFDQPQVLYPQPTENLDVYEIAIPKEVLSEVLKDRKLIMCENQNDEYFNLLKIDKTIFVGVKDSRSVFLEIKRDKAHFGLRDRDFLSDEEIEKLRKAYPNYAILGYYDFENYMYHPDNIAELGIDGFDSTVYIENILTQKNKRKDYILANLSSSRQTYEEFKTDGLKDKEPNSIIEDLASNDFERFYKFFDMKDQFDKTLLAKYNLSKERLVNTKWFKEKISKILMKTK